jgi:hypothetical protein
MAEIRPNSQRSKDAITLIWIVLGISIISFVSSYYQLDLLNRINFDSSITDDTLNANDNRERFIAILYTTAFFISSIKFIQWFRRAHFNLNLKTDSLSYDENKVKWCWFNPLYSFYMPYRIMKEMHFKLTELLKNNNIAFEENLSKSNINTWWALWIIDLFWSKYSNKFSQKATTLSELIDATTLDMIGSVIVIILSFVTIKMIRDYTKLETIVAENDFNTSVILEDVIIEKEIIS